LFAISAVVTHFIWSLRLPGWGKILLSNNTISRRVDVISNNMKALLLESVKQSYFAIQMDERTDIACHAQLLV